MLKQIGNDWYNLYRCRIAYYNWLRQNKNIGIKLTDVKKKDYSRFFFGLQETDAEMIERRESKDYSEGEREYINWESFPKIDPPLKEFAPRKLHEHDEED